MIRAGPFYRDDAIAVGLRDERCAIFKPSRNPGALSELIRERARQAERIDFETERCEASYDISFVGSFFQWYAPTLGMRTQLVSAHEQEQSE